jgi:hypothetical protein
VLSLNSLLDAEEDVDLSFRETFSEHNTAETRVVDALCIIGSVNVAQANKHAGLAVELYLLYTVVPTASQTGENAN